MSYVIQATNASDNSTPHTISDISDISVTKRQTRSEKPHTYYHLAPKLHAADDKLPLGTSSFADTWVLAPTTAKQLDFDDSDVESVDLGGIYSPNSQYDDENTLTEDLKLLLTCRKPTKRPTFLLKNLEHSFLNSQLLAQSH